MVQPTHDPRLLDMPMDLLLEDSNKLFPVNDLDFLDQDTRQFAGGVGNVVADFRGDRPVGEQRWKIGQTHIGQRCQLRGQERFIQHVSKMIVLDVQSVRMGIVHMQAGVIAAHVD